MKWPFSGQPVECFIVVAGIVGDDEQEKQSIGEEIRVIAC